MELSVIIVNYNTAALLKRLLESVVRNLSAVEYEICVIDNASTDESLNVLSTYPQIQVIRNQTNVGFAKGINQGLKTSTGELVVWLNPDTELLDNHFSDIVKYIKDHPEVGILGPTIVNSDGTIQLSCRSFPSYSAALFNRYSLLTRLIPNNRYSRGYLKSDWNHDHIADVDWVSGACLFHRRELTEQIGLLDEGFFLYCEDVDYCFRAAQRGWIVRYHPGSKVLHHISGSSSQNATRSIFERHKSIWRYYSKHFRRNICKDIAVGAGVLGRCGIVLLQHAIHKTEETKQSSPNMRGSN